DVPAPDRGDGFDDGGPSLSSLEQGLGTGCKLIAPAAKLAPAMPGAVAAKAGCAVLNAADKDGKAVGAATADNTGDAVKGDLKVVGEVAEYGVRYLGREVARNVVESVTEEVTERVHREIREAFAH